MARSRHELGDRASAAAQASRLPYAWGRATALLSRWRPPSLADILILFAAGGLVFALLSLQAEWTGPLRPYAHIDLSLAALPKYTLFSLARGLAAYVLSFSFTLVYGYWAAKDRLAGRVLLPLLDVLQSIPVLGFMPGVVLALVAAFPASNVGLELAAIIMIFTGQAWNMTFSFYSSLRAVPADIQEAATLFRFGWLDRLRRVELPFAAIGLVWNSMMSMAGGWFFLMISEAFVLGNRDFRLPGLGSYMSAAAATGNAGAMVAGVVAMAMMILALDQLLWRPLVAWAQKFRVDESGQTEEVRSWFLELLRRSRMLDAAERLLARARARRLRRSHPEVPATAHATPPALGRWLSKIAVLLLTSALLYGAVRLASLLARVSLSDLGGIGAAALATLGRVLAATAIGTLWAVPCGLAIGLSPRLSRVLQPVVQVIASFPAPMLFPAVIAALRSLGVSLGWGSILLMLLGTQWYILFNVIAGATAIPADLREVASVFRMTRLQKLRALYLPATLSYLVTGWITAAGGAWNASIVSEYVTFRGETLATNGLGARISTAAMSGHLADLAASVVCMSLVVVLFNRLVWRRLNELAERRYALTR